MKSNNDLRIKNLHYNKAAFLLFSAISLSSIGLIAYAKEPISKGEIIEVMATDIELEEDNSVDLVYQDSNIKIINEHEQETNVIIEKQYSGMNLSNEYEDDIKRLSEIYNIPYEVVLTIGYRESGGNWNNNGIISSTNDYGVFQINECNLKHIEQNLGYSKDEILNDPIKNAEACMFLLKDIIKRDDVTTVEEVFGMYNGWVGWETKPLAVTYSSKCCEIMNEYFPEFQYKKNQTTK